MCAGASPSSPTRGFLFRYIYGAPLENIQMPNKRTEPASKPESAPMSSVQPLMSHLKQLTPLVTAKMLTAPVDSFSPFQ